MALYGWPVLFVLFAWWFSTGAVIYLNNLPRHTHRWSVFFGTLVAIGSIGGLIVTRDQTTPKAAYVAFTCGLLIWAWTQLTFYTGFIAGPRRTACNPSCNGPKHFWHAVETCLYHEIVAAGLAVGVVVLAAESANTTGAWTYLLLWHLHLSAKLNVVLGVPNLNEQFFPEHLKYLGGFLKKRPMNLLFPFSITGGTVLAVLIGRHAFVAAQNATEAVAGTFLFVLTVLAILEHWFLVLPIPAEALWAWAVKAKTLGQKASARSPASAAPQDRVLERQVQAPATS